MFIVGITGSFGSGKTTVAGMFTKYGAMVIDADAIIRKLLTSEGDCIKKVVKVFGCGILISNQIDRNALAKIVFRDPRELKKLTDILYPIGLKEIKRQINRQRKAKLVVLDVPLLFESGWNQLTDVNIVVKSNQTTQIKRLLKAKKISRANIVQRLKYQMPLKEKLHRADIIIDNHGSLSQTNAQVKAIVHRFLPTGR